MNEDSLYIVGDAVKALGDGRIGGYLVRFTDADNPDVVGDFFTAQTDFDIESGDKTTVYYEHGYDAKLKTRKLGKGVMTIDEVGVWLEAQLALRDEYEKAIYSMAEKGKLGLSSGTLSHLVEAEPVGKSQWIKYWPLGKDASLTPRPAAGPTATAVVTLKQLTSLDIATQEPEAAGDAAAEAEPVPEPVTLTHHVEVITMTDEIKTVVSDPRIDQLASVVGDLAQTVKALAEGPSNAGTAGVLVTGDEADRAVKGNPFRNLGEQLIAVRNWAYGDQDIRLRPLKAVLGQNEGIPSEGGFLVSTAQDSGIERKVWETGVFANRAQRRELPAGSNSMDFYGIQEDSRAAGSRYGGVTGYRVAEAATITASGAIKFYKYTLKPKKYAALMYLTDEVLTDARVVEQEVMSALPAELAFMVDDDMYRGLGVAGCYGILNHPALVSVAAESGQAATSLVYENIVKMWARRYIRGSYAWFVNQDVAPMLDTMAHTVGLGGIAPRFVTYDASGAMSIYGAPVIVNEFSNTLGTVGDIVLADWGQYKLATIGGVQSASSIHVQFLTDQTAYRFTWRVDGQPTWKSDLTPFQGTNDVSPFIALATRS